MLGIIQPSKFFERYITLSDESFQNPGKNVTISETSLKAMTSDDNISAYALKREKKLPLMSSSSKAVHKEPRYLKEDFSNQSSAPAHITLSTNLVVIPNVWNTSITRKTNEIASNGDSGPITQLNGEGVTYGLEPGETITNEHLARHITPPKKIMKLVGQAVKDWNMIEEGDRLLLGLSGGKDSLALLHILLALQKRAPVQFEISCATVDPQTSSFDPSPLIPYLKSLGVTYHYLSEPIVEMAKSKLQGDSLCAFCSRFKRGLLYSCCR